MIEFALTSTEIAAILGFSIGLLWGEAFSRFDQNIKYVSSWYKKLAPFTQWFVSSVFDATHHFQYGLAIILFTQVVVLPELANVILSWLGWGLVVSDWKDYKNVLKRLSLNGASSK